MPDKPDPIPFESIPPQDSVSRIFLKLPPGVDVRSTLDFEYDKVREERACSVVWRRYAPTVADVHAAGLLTVGEINAGRAAGSAEYDGFRTAVVAAIRAIKNAKGDGLDVLPVPESGKSWHAHIALVPAGGQDPQKVKSLRRDELRERLFEVLAPFEQYLVP